MRTLLGCVAVVAFGGLLAADDKKDGKIDAKKLVGKWQAKDQRGGITEYTKDGKVLRTATRDGQEKQIEGTYTVDENKLTIKMGATAPGVDWTIAKLNDTDLVLTKPVGAAKERTYVRVKDEKK
jgi:uncharacterized protein (TIGR03066 family)